MNNKDIYFYVMYKGKRYPAKRHRYRYCSELIQIYSNHMFQEGMALCNYSNGKYRYAYNILYTEVIKITVNNTIGGKLL